MSLRGDVKLINQGSGAPGPIPVPSTTTVYSRAFRLNYSQAFGLWLMAGNGSGAANMSIFLEQSAFAPTIEGSQDNNYVVGDGVAPIYSILNDAIAHVKTVSPIPMKYGRFKITGLGSNPADATINIYLFEQEIVT